MIFIQKLLILLLCIPGLRGQCYNCKDNWDTECKVREKGVKCGQGYIITEAPGDETIRKWDACAPPGQKIERVDEYCCIFSPEMGCQVALSELAFKEKRKYCRICTKYCQCEVDAASMLQPWHWCGLCAMLSTLMYRMQK